MGLWTDTGTPPRGHEGERVFMEAVERIVCPEVKTYNLTRGILVVPIKPEPRDPVRQSTRRRIEDWKSGRKGCV